MARHRLTKEEQRKGTQRALESPRTPPQLKKGLKKRQKQLGDKADGRNTGSQDSKKGHKSAGEAEENIKHADIDNIAHDSNSGEEESDDEESDDEESDGSGSKRSE
jgi:hypothetical protein